TGRAEAWDSTRFWGAVRGDLLIRPSNGGIRVGPALEVGTVGFSDARFAAGATVLAPIGDLLAAAVTPGGYIRTGGPGAVGGVSARAFFGARVFGYDPYSLSAGLVLGFDRDLGASRDHALLVAAQVDGLVLALPVLLFIAWLKGSPS